jgi:hypothetical protein
MRWEDERYVRVYTRDTAELIGMSWQARALLWELMRKADRAGFVSLGRAGLRGLAGLVRMPLEVVEEALPDLLVDGCVVQLEGRLLLPNFVAAQETPRSDAARKRDQRMRERETALQTSRESGPVEPPMSRFVTDVTDTVTRVTDAVTKCHSVPNRAVPNHAEREIVVEPLAQADDVVGELRLADERERVDTGSSSTTRPSTPPTSTTPSRPPPRPTPRPVEPEPPREEPSPPPPPDPDVAKGPSGADVTAVLEHWAKTLYPKRTPRFDDKRKKRVRARLADFTVAELKRAVDGVVFDDWLMGRNDRARAGGYRDVETIFRDTAQVERLLELAEKHDPVRRRPSPEPAYDESACVDDATANAFVAQICKNLGWGPEEWAAGVGAIARPRPCHAGVS